MMSRGYGTLVDQSTALDLVFLLQQKYIQDRFSWSCGSYVSQQERLK